MNIRQEDDRPSTVNKIRVASYETQSTYQSRKQIDTNKCRIIYLSADHSR